ncbi:MAG: RcnB family protein [Proteobacteria bacterium]|nr:RcnB family protein [Pseudomonadota bacterium]
MKWLVIAITVFVFSPFSLMSSAIADVEVSIVFSDDEIRIIGVWYHDHGSVADKKPGKSKRNRLPPGIAKNLTRGKSLPPGIAKQYLPDRLRQTLPAPSAGYERIVVDSKILLVEIATGVIHDILVDVVLD